MVYFDYYPVCKEKETITHIKKNFFEINISHKNLVKCECQRCKSIFFFDPVM